MTYQIGFFDRPYQTMLRKMFAGRRIDLDDINPVISSYNALLDMPNLRVVFETEDDYLMFVLKYS